MEISEHAYVQIRELCAEGDVLVEMEEFADAFKNYMAALELVPEPRESHEATTWILAALGDLYFLTGSYGQAAQAFADAMHCPGAIGNPFLHLRLGQVHFELGDEARAADELARAYMGAGRQIFEEDDAKYFDFLKTRIEPPASGVW